MTDNFAAQEATMTVIILYQRKSSPSDCHLFPAAMRELNGHEVKMAARREQWRHDGIEGGGGGRA